MVESGAIPLPWSNVAYTACCVGDSKVSVILRVALLSKGDKWDRDCATEQQTTGDETLIPASGNATILTDIRRMDEMPGSGEIPSHLYPCLQYTFQRSCSNGLAQKQS
ncbi:hypothetical protein E2C01_013544 [Portunus trituberculatus]|uniref:Uncharacterized protein n=1 Tax=Portunus trituberculatus TaxID=210409 RepID=A0A5B7DGJ3_PORTR|nr:hypothetical protein [Portunus trituberculatus]